MPSFEERYGKKFQDMDAGEKELVIVSSLERIETHLEGLNGKVKRVGVMEKLVATGAVVIPALAIWLAWLTKGFIGK